jgi:hypothetical protein
MSNFTKKKYNDFAVGWIKSTKEGKEYVSAVVSAGSKKTPVQVDMFVSINGGPQQKVESFAGFFTPNEDKDGKPRHEKAPHIKFTFTTEA